MEQNCKEQILDDIVQVDIVAASKCLFVIPFQTAGIITMRENDKTIGPADISILYNVQNDGEWEMDSAPLLKQSEKRSAAGIIVSHDLQVPILSGFESMREATNALHTKDFHVVMTTQEGVRYLLYSLPNSCEILFDEQDVNQSSTIKVSLQSMSHIIRLTKN